MFRVARVGLHHFEEPCLSGERGSGTVFFSGCNLRCVFCQNAVISHGGRGLNVTEEQLFHLFEYLKNIGAHNINLVTPSSWIEQLISVLKKAKTALNLPIVWNSSGYESVELLEKLEGIVDIYLPDFKYSDNNLAKEYSGVDGYFEKASAAITEMRRQQPEDVFDSDGMMVRGVIVRHLVLPSAHRNTVGVLRRIAEIDTELYVSLMGQYFPTAAVEGHPTLGRRLTQDEYDLALDAFFDAGLKNGFSQSIDSAIEEYVPSFDLEELKKLI